MKTIAISIDEISLAALDRWARGADSGKGTKKRRQNRSEVVRRALHEFFARQARRAREESDRKVLAANRQALSRQAKALMAEQAPR